MHKKVKDGSILYIGDYHPFYHGTNKDFDEFSNMILKLKEQDDEAVKFFYDKIKMKLGENFTIVVVPSHSVNTKNSGIRKLAIMLAKDKKNIIDGTECLIRIKEIKKLSHGGNRSLDIQLESMKVVKHDLIQGKDILLLDDVKTSGNTIKAAIKLLKESGAKKVVALVLGRTITKKKKIY